MTSKIAVKIMLSLLIAVVLFHLSIVLKLIPYEITWGGRLKNDSEMYVFETVSILINLLLFWALLTKGGYVRAFVSLKVVDIILWIFVVLFGFNTVGNILAKTTLEKSFAALTFASAVLLWIILTSDKKRTRGNA